jgi:hypothetical protein
MPSQIVLVVPQHPPAAYSVFNVAELVVLVHARHVEHTRSDVGVPATTSYEPAPHSEKGVQTESVLLLGKHPPVEKEPASQVVQRVQTLSVSVTGSHGTASKNPCVHVAAHCPHTGTPLALVRATKPGGQVDTHCPLTESRLRLPSHSHWGATPSNEPLPLHVRVTSMGRNALVVSQEYVHVCK